MRAKENESNDETTILFNIAIGINATSAGISLILLILYIVMGIIVYKKVKYTNKTLIAMIVFITLSLICSLNHAIFYTIFWINTKLYWYYISEPILYYESID